MVINLSLLVKYVGEISYFTVKLRVLPVLPIQWLLYKNVQNFTPPPHTNSQYIDYYLFRLL